jgi:hypothetical protein
MSKRKATMSDEQAAWQGVVASFAKDGLAIIFTEYFNPFTTNGGWPSGLAAEEITREKMLSYPHVLVAKKHGAQILKTYNDMEAARQQNSIRATDWAGVFWDKVYRHPIERWTST